MTIISMILSDGGERFWRYSPACSLGARQCDGCGATNTAILRTVIHHGEPEDALRVVNDSLPLCAGCSLDTDRRWNAEWPEQIERVDVIALWAHVNAERQREAQQQAERGASRHSGGRNDDRR